MITTVDKVTFEFDNTCTMCGVTWDSPTFATMTDIIEVGCPGCPECGQDYALKDTCVIDLTRVPTPDPWWATTEPYTE